jgi:hypothetical protein
MSLSLKLLRVSIVLLGAAGTAGATDIPVTGLKLVVVDKTVASGLAKAVFVAKDPNVTKGTGTSLIFLGADLGIAYDTTRGVFNMPSGPGWIVNKSTIAKYVNKTAPSGGAAKVNVIKQGSLIKVVGKSLGDTPIDISTAPSGDVFVSHTLANSGEIFRHCTRFGTCTHTPIAGGTGYKLVCKGDSTGDPTCAGAPPPDCCAAPLQFCYLQDPIVCSVTFGTPGGPNSVCDSVTGTCLGSANPGNCCGGIPDDVTCIAGPQVDATICAGQPGGGGTFSASGVCAPDGSCN